MGVNGRGRIGPVISLVDRSGQRYALDEPRWRGDDGSPLMVERLPGITR